MSEIPDARVVARVLAGEREAYALLVARYQERLFRHALGMVGDTDAAQDLVQDALVRAFVRLEGCRDPERFGTWLFTLLRNRCTDHLRERRRRDIPLDGDAPYADSREGPAAPLERQEALAAVHRALAALPAAQREAFLLKHVEELSYEQMAERLDAGISALKMRVARAREAVRAVLAEEGRRECDAGAAHPSHR